MWTDKQHITNILLALIFVVLAGLYIRTVSQPLDGTLPMSAVAPYQGNAADGITSTGNSILVGGKTVTNGAQSLRTDTSGRLIVQAYGATTMTLDGEEVVLGTGDNYVGRVNITESVTIVVTDSDGALNVRQATRGALLADVTMQIADTDVGAANPVPVTDTAGPLTVDIDPRHLDDVLTNVLKVIDAEHSEVHEGEMYEASYTAQSLADEATQYIWLTTGANTVHFAFAAAGGGTIDVSMWETPTLTAGTLITPVNMKRDSAMASTVVISHTPTVTTTGTALFENLLIPGGAGPQAAARVGGAARSAAEWILAAYRSHLIGIKNESGGAISVTWQTNFYEE